MTNVAQLKAPRLAAHTLGSGSFFGGEDKVAESGKF